MHIHLFFKHMCTYKCYLNYIFLKSGLTQVVFVLLVVVAKFIELGSTMGLIKPNEADVKGICIICFTLLLSIKWWAESRPTTWFIVFIFRTLMYPKNRLELCFQGTIYGLKCEHPTFFLEIFSTSDTNGDGFISVDELKKATARYDIELTGQKLAEIYSQSDIDGDRKLDYQGSFFN